jgi:hypothetical protein
MPSERTAPRAAPGASLWERAATVAHRLPRELHDPLAPNTSRGRSWATARGGRGAWWR